MLGPLHVARDYRSDRFVKSVRVLTFKDVNIEELNAKELELPKELAIDE